MEEKEKQKKNKKNKYRGYETMFYAKYPITAQITKRWYLIMNTLAMSSARVFNSIFFFFFSLSIFNNKVRNLVGWSRLSLLRCTFRFFFFHNKITTITRIRERSFKSRTLTSLTFQSGLVNRRVIFFPHLTYKAWGK